MGEPSQQHPWLFYSDQWRYNLFWRIIEFHISLPILRIELHAHRNVGIAWLGEWSNDKNWRNVEKLQIFVTPRYWKNGFLARLTLVTSLVIPYTIPLHTNAFHLWGGSGNDFLYPKNGNSIKKSDIWSELWGDMTRNQSFGQLKKPLGIEWQLHGSMLWNDYQYLVEPSPFHSPGIELSTGKLTWQSSQQIHVPVWNFIYIKTGWS